MEKELIFHAEAIGESVLQHAAFNEVENCLSVQETGFDFDRWKQAVLRTIFFFTHLKLSQTMAPK